MLRDEHAVEAAKQVVRDRDISTLDLAIDTAISAYLSTTSAGVTEEQTPASKWRQEGKEDPHGNRYECERAKLAMGHLTDDELANAVFMADRSSLDLIAYQTAAKDRIRWLSRALEASRVAPVSQKEAVPVKELKEFRIAGQCNCSGCLRIRRDADAARSALHPTPTPVSAPVGVVEELIREAIDLLKEKKYGNPARSPGHNARLMLEDALAALRSPAVEGK